MLESARAKLNVVSQDTNTPVDVLLKPRTLRNMCWQAGERTGFSAEDEVDRYLASHEARRWQRELLVPTLAAVVCR